MSDSAYRSGYIDRVAAWFGIGDLDFRLTHTDRRRLLLASALPILILVGDVILLLLQAFAHVPYYYPDFAGDITPDQFWRHLASFIATVEDSLLPVAIALLFVYSIYPVGRPQASWGLLICAACVSGAICFAVLAALPPLFYDDSIDPITDWYVVNWSRFAHDFGFLAIGYAFLAYRGLSRTRLPSPRRRVRIPPPPSQPREL